MHIKITVFGEDGKTGFVFSSLAQEAIVQVAVPWFLDARLASVITEFNPAILIAEARLRASVREWAQLVQRLQKTFPGVPVVLAKPFINDEDKAKAQELGIGTIQTIFMIQLKTVKEAAGI